MESNTFSQDLEQFVEDLRANGINGPFVKQALEDLGADQIRTETDVAQLNRKVLIVGAAAVGGLVCAGLALRMSKALIEAMQQLGAGLLTTQQAVGLVPGGPQSPVRDEAGEAASSPEPGTRLHLVDDAVDVGAGGYDPGPQPVPPEVRDAILSDDLPPLDDIPETDLH